MWRRIIDRWRNPSPAHRDVELDSGAEAEVRSVRGLRVLLIDDDEHSRSLLAGTLSYYGAEVAAVGSVSEALAVLDRLRPQVLVSHCVPPTADHFAFLQRVRAMEAERGGRIPRIVLQPVGAATDTSCLVGGFPVAVRRPFDPQEVVAVIRRVAAGGVPA